MRRIGPRMHAAVEYVRLHPSTPILPVAIAVGPHHSAQYGYRTVHRAIEAGLITATHRGGHYCLVVP